MRKNGLPRIARVMAAGWDFSGRSAPKHSGALKCTAGMPGYRAWITETKRTLGEGTQRAMTAITDHDAPAAELDYTARRALCAAEVTLDGQPAKVSGARAGSAHVTAIPDGPAVELAWAEVARVVAEDDGRFTS
jgi:hypothetical protein